MEKIRETVYGTVYRIEHKAITIMGSDGIMYRSEFGNRPEFKKMGLEEGDVVFVTYIKLDQGDTDIIGIAPEEVSELDETDLEDDYLECNLRMVV